MAQGNSLRALVNRAFQVKPLIGDGHGNKYFVEPVELYDNYLFQEHQTVGSANDLTELATLNVEIPVGFRDTPKPKIADVLPQIPKDLLAQASAFDLSLRDAMLSGEDMSVTATLTLFKGALPDDVKNQPVIARGQRYDKPIPRPKKAKPAEIFNPAAAGEMTKPVAAPRTAVFKPKAPPAAGI